MSIVFIPIDAEVPSQKFRVTLDSQKVEFHIRWQETPQRWFISLNCEAVGLHSEGLGLVTGQDFLANRTQEQLGMLMLLDLQGDEDPDFEGLGIRWKLTYASRSDVETI